MSRRSTKALVAAWCVGLVVALVAAPAQGQRRVAVKAAVVDEEQPEEKHDGFSVRKEDAKFNDALQDFERYRDKKAWALAFRSLESLSQGKREGMVAAGKGFFVPSAQRVMLALTTLPPDGKQAFRLFYDARAKQLLDRVEAATGVGSPNTPARSGGSNATPVDEIATLREIYNKYFITSVGDRAADRLGDALFESGDFAAAAAAWATILRESPDTGLSRPRLHVKRAVALARGGQWDLFDDTLRAIRTEFAGERITVGGREVVASDFVESLRSSSPTTAPSARPEGPAVADAAAAPVEMPQEDAPAWQFRLLDPTLSAKLEQALNNNGWGRQMTGLATHVPDVGTDGQRVYTNWLGIVFAVDVRTGKLQWRNRKFSVLGDKFQNLINNMLDVDCYSLTVSGKRLFVTGINLDRIQNYREPVRLVCMNTADGKVNWQSTSTGLANWNFIGKPAIVGDVLYAVARNAQAQDMTLLALGADKGELRWQLLLGTAQAGQNYRGEPDMPVPTLLPHGGGGTLYVLTNNGALLSVDTSARKLNWAFTYAPPPISDRQRFWNGEQSRPNAKMAAAVFVQGSTLYLKEEDGDAVHAIDLEGPSLLWRRPIDRANTVARLPSGQLLSIGQDLGAIDPETRAMKWSASLPALATRLTPVVGQDRLMAFASRGIYEINLTNGDTMSIVRGADRDSIGGTLFRVPGRLISVSNLALTAYPTSDAEPISKAELEHLREFIDRPTMFDAAAAGESD